MNYHMTVDPSSRSMGVAVWSARRWKTLDVPVSTYLLKGSPSDEWTVSAAQIGAQVASIMRDFNIIAVHCEFPPFIQTSAQSGAQAKLMHSAGMIAGLCAAQETPPTFDYVDVNTWKGNLPKALVIKRVADIYHKANIECPTFRNDEWDAVGIGLYLKGKF